MNQRCKNCYFWVLGRENLNMTKDEDALCFRYPPVLDPNYIDSDPEAATETSAWHHHTITNQEDWCGEFKPRSPGKT